MWVFAKDGKSWTCPQNSLIQIARIQASDRDDAFKECIVNNEIAKAYLEKQGFEVTELPEPEEPTEVPKVANWYNHSHRALYDKLFYHEMDRPLTEAENEFVKQMYHAEEYACGLDGDR